MGASLGIFISSNRHIEKIIKLCNAAKKKGITVRLFFTHLGTRLTQDPQFEKLKGLDMAVCKVAFEGFGLKPPVPGLGDEDYATQAIHAELLDECDRYVVF